MTPTPFAAWWKDHIQGCEDCYLTSLGGIVASHAFLAGQRAQREEDATIAEKDLDGEHIAKTIRASGGKA